MSAPTRLWGGRFSSGPAEALERLSVSVQFDWRLAPYDIRQTRAHANVLHRAGLLSDAESTAVSARRSTTSTIAVDLPGTFRPNVEDEDVHTAIERGLLERLGSTGGKLRAGRSRNDQVATDLRLYLREHVRALIGRGRRPRRGSRRPGGSHDPRRAGARPDPHAARSAGPLRPPPAGARAGAAPRRRPPAGLGPPR